MTDSRDDQCAMWQCKAGTLPHMPHCYAHVPRYEIPPYEEIECPECGKTGGHGTLSDSMYYCRDDDCKELFDPRRLDYLRKLRKEPERWGKST